MAAEILTPTNITFSLGIIEILFTIFFYFRNPQEELDKRQSVSQKEIEGKATILAQQLQWEKEANERRFKELSDALVASTALAQNHIHTVDTKVDGLMTTIGNMNTHIGTELMRLSTIIEERFLRK